MASRAAVPTLSNEAQLKIMNLVKGGMSMDEALKKAAELEKKEKLEKDKVCAIVVLAFAFITSAALQHVVLQSMHLLIHLAFAACSTL